MTIYTNPFFGLIRTLTLFLLGRVRFDKNPVGSNITMQDGAEFIIFRRVTIRRFTRRNHMPEALFIVRFTPTMDIVKNIKLSRVMLLIFMGFRGFRSKYWCVNQDNGMCQGLYEWETMQDAQNYSQSIAITNMTRRSVPGSISYKVLPNTAENRKWRISGDPDKIARFRLAYSL